MDALVQQAPTAVPVSHYENFPVASWVGPPALRGAISAIYAFARGADDIADEGDDPPAVRLAGLDRYARMLDSIETAADARVEPVEPPFEALAAAVRRHALPVAPFRDLLSAFRQDVTKPRYADIDELFDYCRRSANPIGRLLLHLYGVFAEVELGRADAICTGLQLANFWQDIALDWAKGRVYLPADDMARFGVERASDRRRHRRRAMAPPDGVRGRTDARPAPIGAPARAGVAAARAARAEDGGRRRLAHSARDRRRAGRRLPAQAGVASARLGDDVCCDAGRG